MPLRLEITVPARVRVGEPVPMVLTLRNDGPTSVDVWLATGLRQPSYEVAVHRLDGSLIWRRLAGQAVGGTLQPVSLDPGGTLDLAHVWDQRDLEGRPVPPGVYSARGQLPEAELGGAWPVTEDRPFIIEP